MKMIDIRLFRRYAAYFRAPALPLLAIVIFAILQAGSLLSIAYLVGVLFDQAIPSADLSTVLRAVSVMVLLYGLNSGLSVWSRHVILTLTKRAVADLRRDLLDVSYRMSWEAYTHRAQTDLHSIMVHDTERIDMMTSAFLGQIVPALVVSGSLGLLMITISPYLFLFLVGMVIVLYATMALTRPQLSRNVVEFHSAFDGISSGVHHILKRMQLTRTSAFETEEIERHHKRIDALYVTSRRLAWFGTAVGTVQDTVVFVFSLMILIAGGWAVGQQMLTLGQLLTFYVILGMLRGYFRVSTVALPQVVEGIRALKETVSFIDDNHQRPYSTGIRSLDFQGTIGLEHVRFSYGSQVILRDVSLSLSPGTTAAVVGRNGAGKSTIASLILGLYQAESGKLTADDIPYDELDISTLRRQIGFVPQNPLLIPGTIRDNISYGQTEISDEEIEQAARISTAHDFIVNLPDQYDTATGDDGIYLSGGQRQRIALARAILNNPKLLILDEPTNHLEQDLIVRFITNLRSQISLPAILLFTHSLQLIRQADLVYWLDEGIIRAQGEHDHLIGQEKIYQQIFQPQ